MTLKEDIEREYAKLLDLARDYDSCFESEPEPKGFGSSSLPVKEKVRGRYWTVREKLELNLPRWMKLLRKSLDTIPSNDRKYRMENRVHYETQETYTVKVYDNENFSSLVGFFNAIKLEVEGHNGILAKVRNSKLIYSQLRNMKGDVLSFSNSLDVFIPEKMASIEQQVDIIFKLRELGLEKAAEEIEGIDEEEDNRLKCLKARTALEQIVENYCEKHGITHTTFYYNLLHAIEKGMTKKEQQKSIAAHYSFVSKIVHKEIDANSRNTQYAIYGIFNIISSLILEKEE